MAATYQMFRPDTSAIIQGSQGFAEGMIEGGRGFMNQMRATQQARINQQKAEADLLDRARMEKERAADNAIAQETLGLSGITPDEQVAAFGDSLGNISTAQAAEYLKARDKSKVRGAMGKLRDVMTGDPTVTTMAGTGPLSQIKDKVSRVEAADGRSPGSLFAGVQMDEEQRDSEFAAQVAELHALGAGEVAESMANAYAAKKAARVAEEDRLRQIAQQDAEEQRRAAAETRAAAVHEENLTSLRQASEARKIALDRAKLKENEGWTMYSVNEDGAVLAHAFPNTTNLDQAVANMRGQGVHLLSEGAAVQLSTAARALSVALAKKEGDIAAAGSAIQQKAFVETMKVFGPGGDPNMQDILYNAAQGDKASQMQVQRVFDLALGNAIAGREGGIDMDLLRTLAAGQKGTPKAGNGRGFLGSVGGGLTNKASQVAGVVGSVLDAESSAEKVKRKYGKVGKDKVRSISDLGPAP